MSGNSPIKLLNGILLGMALSLVESGLAQTNVTPAQWLALQPKPVFKPGHQLPHLSQFAWPYPYALRLEMATNWGYALPIDGPHINGALEKALANTNSDTYRAVALCSNYSTKFKLQVDLDRSWPTNLSNGFWVTNAIGWFVDNNTNTWQYRTNLARTPIVSPEAPAADLALQAESIVAPLRLLSNVPVAIIMNGGERDLGVTGFDIKSWQFDPRIRATAVVTNRYDYFTNNTGMSWPKYISMAKSNHLAILTAAVKAAVPNRELYVWYNTGNEQGRFHIAGYDWANGWANWGWLSDHINPAVEIPSFENYYTGPASWTNATGTAWNNVTDLLTKHLNAVGFNLGLGYSNHYTFVCGGWHNFNSNRLAAIPRYTGFLKCLYTSGMIGAVAGYFEYPTNTAPSIFGNNGFAGSFPTNIVPHWLLQIEALARVHAQFSYLEDYLWNGSLLPGNGNMTGAPATGHFMSRDQPSYEFTNTVADATCRVLVRKHNSRNEWLITAWKADGADRTVTVTIPTLGQVSVLASAAGSVYRATPDTVTRLNEVGVPTGPLTPPTRLRVVNTNSP